MNTRTTPRLSGPAMLAVTTVLAITGTGLVALSAPSGPPHPAGVAPAERAALSPTAHGVEPHPAAAAGPSPAPHAPAPASPATADGSTPDPAAGAPLPPPGAGEGADPWVQHALDRATAPDLPKASARRLTALAKAVWTADATGTGRNRWPGYFTDPAPQATYTRFRIQAAATRRDPHHPGGAVVRLVWAGADPAGTFLDGRTATIRFAPKGDSWTPAR